ncbi:hypothetical protein JG687_00014814 [Phytophthora cactorum]|uniref:Uncharacterized protein n=1 Tax=Phytophthora cactorum TaxID=29920 RepID=A0A329SDW6_9STRA|nr:hypothetical protein PC116_g4710 [Phytophthora cactorum]KAG6949537.1 hypothetical protein JG687_00014814 [Phytophthora cactorum]RAW34974.1 hypothetical protein PC110_g8726 [Phytophthora cactorum]
MDESDEAAFVRLRLWGIVPDGADEGGLITSGQLEDEETKAEEDAGELASEHHAVLQPLDVGIMGPFKKMCALSLDYEIQLLVLNRNVSLRDRLKLLKNTSAQKQREVLVD